MARRSLLKLTCVRSGTYKDESDENLTKKCDRNYINRLHADVIYVSHQQSHTHSILILDH